MTNDSKTKMLTIRLQAINDKQLISCWPSTTSSVILPDAVGTMHVSYAYFLRASWFTELAQSGALAGWCKQKYIEYDMEINSKAIL